MSSVEFIYEKDCPSVESTRSQLIQVFSKLKIKPHWVEWEISDTSAPDYVRRYGSPTILINGKDVGKINVLDIKSYVAVNKKVLKVALRKLANGKMKGRSFKVRHLTV